jgi:hypothetical protein
MMICMTPEQRLAQIRRTRAEYDRVRERLFHQITEALDAAQELPEAERRLLGPSAVGRAARFTREYIAKVRDARSPHRDSGTGT